MATVTGDERRPGAFRPRAHRVPARRRRPGRPVQLAVRPPRGRHVRPAHRGHRPRAVPRRAGGGHRAVAEVARPRLGRGPLPPVRAHAPLRGRRPSGWWRRATPTTATAPRTTSPPATPSGGYDGFCRDRGLGPGPGRALRFRTPDDGETVVHDVIRGDVVFENANLEDFVVLRAGGEPMFILANAVDDADMRITHVLRGEDLLSSTPKVLLLRHALGYGPPTTPLRPPAGDREREAPEAVEAARRRGPGGVPGAGLPAPGHAQLPGPARVGPAQRRGDPAHRRDGRASSGWRT